MADAGSEWGELEGIANRTDFDLRAHQIGMRSVGKWQGEDISVYYPEGAKPVVSGEAVNTATTYGYDPVTMMQETKTTLCQIEKAA